MILSDDAPMVCQQLTRPSSKSLPVATKMPDQYESGNPLEYSKQLYVKNFDPYSDHDR